MYWIYPLYSNFSTGEQFSVGFVLISICTSRRVQVNTTFEKVRAGNNLTNKYTHKSKLKITIQGNLESGGKVEKKIKR